MKREDFFEALSDIDENLVAKARPEGEEVAPVIVTPRKSRLKPLCISAASIAAAAAVTVAAVNLSRLPSLGGFAGTSGEDPAAPVQKYKTTVRTLKIGDYPYSASPVYTGDYSDIDDIRCLWDTNNLGSHKTQTASYEELAAESDIVVMGTFVGDTYQLTDLYDIPDFETCLLSSAFDMHLSFNRLRVEKVLKGEGRVCEGDEVVISQNYVVTYGERMYCADLLTPMIKGDSWIYFLKRYGEYDSPPDVIKGCYYAVNDYEGRYPVPDKENTAFEHRENKNGVFSPAVFNEGIYEELKKKLAEAAEAAPPAYNREYEKVVNLTENIDAVKQYPANIKVEFELEEFPGTVFDIVGGSLYTWKKGNYMPELKLGGSGCYVQAYYTYLCDLNGDGYREICTVVSFGSGIINEFIFVWDYANDKNYILSDRGKYDYLLGKRAGELVYTQMNPTWYYVNSMPSEEIMEANTHVLTLDVMTDGDDLRSSWNNSEPITEDNIGEPAVDKNVTKIMETMFGSDGYILNMPVTFDMEEFPNIMFLREPSDGGDTLSAAEDDVFFTLFKSGNIITSIYLCDLNGDGKREICAGISRPSNLGTIESSIAVCDYENGMMYLLSDEDRYDYLLGVKDDVLTYQKFDAATGNELNYEPLRLDVMDAWTFDVDEKS